MKGKETLKLHSQCLTSDRGLTLLELLLSIFIGAIVLTVLYASFFQIIKAKDSAESELELYHEVRVVFSKMTEDLAMAYPMGLVFPVEDSDASSFFVGTVEGENSSVNFNSLSHKRGINSSDSDEAIISYFLEPIPENDLFSLMRSENPRIGASSSGIRYALSERVVGLDISYLSSNGEEYVDTWDSAQSNSLPKAVEIRLTMRSDKGEDVVFSSLILIPSAN